MNFTIPNKIYIVRNCAELRTMDNEDEKFVALAAIDEFEDDYPGDFGYKVKAEIEVRISDEAFYPGTDREWINALEEKALDAFKKGQDYINA